MVLSGPSRSLSVRMPLLRFDLIEGRSEAELKSLLDAAHRAMLAAFGVPERDRYQIVTEHPRAHMIIEDTGLGLTRSDKLVMVQVTTRNRKKNRDEDWSFGLGRAQFLTKEL